MEKDREIVVRPPRVDDGSPPLDAYDGRLQRAVKRSPKHPLPKVLPKVEGRSSLRNLAGQVAVKTSSGELRKEKMRQESADFEVPGKQWRESVSGQRRGAMIAGLLRLSEHSAARLIGIGDIDVFREKFAKDYEFGPVQIVADVVSSLVTAATKSGRPNIAAIKYLLGSQLGWQESSTVNIKLEKTPDEADIVIDKEAMGRLAALVERNRKDRDEDDSEE